jgi:hypothetical protein
MLATEVVSIHCFLRQLTASFLGNGKLLKCIKGPLKIVQSVILRTHSSLETVAVGGGGAVRNMDTCLLNSHDFDDFDDFDIEFRVAIYVVTVHVNSRGNCLLGCRYASSDTKTPPFQRVGSGSTVYIVGKLTI